jgi:cytosine/adenosine deaminase-related metal-dependent hydrolase
LKDIIMLDLIIRNAKPAFETKINDIAIDKGRIVSIGKISAKALHGIDACGNLVTPPFVDSHFHRDAALTFGRPRINQTGILLEGINLWKELKPTLDIDEIKTRALKFCRWSIARGILAIRSHVDISDPNLFAVKALLDVRKEMKKCFAAITKNGAKVLDLDDYGLKPGKKADLVILQCQDEVDALRFRPARLYVLKTGKIIARTNPVNPEIFPASKLKPGHSPPESLETFCP